MAAGHLPLGLDLEILADLSGLVGEHVLQLLLLLTKHLHFPLRELDFFIHLANHLLESAEFSLETA